MSEITDQTRHQLNMEINTLATVRQIDEILKAGGDASEIMNLVSAKITTPGEAERTSPQLKSARRPVERGVHKSPHSADVGVSLNRQEILSLLDGLPVQRETPAGPLRFIGVPSLPWTPMKRVQDPPQLAGQAWDEAWLNDTYDCLVRCSESGLTHLSIKRLDRAPLRNWRHLQQIKNEVVGNEREAAEIFPAESRLADNANQYHLWVLPSGMAMPFGFPSGMVVMEEDDVQTLNANGDKSRQEPLQEGLTIGETMRAAQERLPGEAQAVFRSALRGGFA